MDNMIIEKKRVLLIDGNIHYRNLFRLLARRANVLASTAVSGKEALVVLRKFKMDAIFVDCQLADLNIVEIAHALRNVAFLKKNADTPIIALAAHMLSYPQIRELEQVDIYHHFHKDDLMDELGSIVARVAAPRSGSATTPMAAPWQRFASPTAAFQKS